MCVRNPFCWENLQLYVLLAVLCLFIDAAPSIFLGSAEIGQGGWNIWAVIILGGLGSGHYQIPKKNCLEFHIIWGIPNVFWKVRSFTPNAQAAA